MTYTILGHCERTGRLGVGLATYSIAAGGLCFGFVSNAGALTSQAFVNPELRTIGTRLLADGHPAAHVLATLVETDPQIDFRQVGVIDAYGRGAAHTGDRTRSWAGHRIGPGYIALGNVLAGGHVVDAMATAFEKAADAALDERMLRALEAGRDAGGQVGGQGHLPERSAALIVHGRAPHAELDLRVDLHPDAVTSLRELHAEFTPYLPLHRLRHIDPAQAPPQEVFAAEIEAKRAQGRRRT
jgi:uncharacterized Ntn-hydrolase superfamily protein